MSSALSKNCRTTAVPWSASNASLMPVDGTPGGGLTDSPSQVYVRQVAGNDPPEQGDRYGWSLAACDFNGDRFDDLAVGVDPAQS